jgi:acylphosphatase
VNIGFFMFSITVFYISNKTYLATSPTVHCFVGNKRDGEFTIKVNFPTGGEYKLYADYAPKGVS